MLGKNSDPKSCERMVYGAKIPCDSLLPALKKCRRLPTLYPALKKCRAPRRDHIVSCLLPECTGWDRCRPPSVVLSLAKLFSTLYLRLRGLSLGRVGVSASHESPGRYLEFIDYELGWFTPLINLIVCSLHHGLLTRFSRRFPSRTFAGFPSEPKVPVGTLASPRDGVRGSQSIQPNIHTQKELYSSEESKTKSIALSSR